MLKCALCCQTKQNCDVVFSLERNKWLAVCAECAASLPAPARPETRITEKKERRGGASVSL